MATLSGDKELMDRLNEMVANLDVGTLSVGFHSGDKYPDGTPVAAVAFWNEFGTGKIPPRPFFRQTIAKESPDWGRALAVMLKKNNMDGEKSLNALGAIISGQVSESIADFSTPANAASTVARKGFNDPLVWNGDLEKSVTWVIE